MRVTPCNPVLARRPVVASHPGTRATHGPAVAMVDLAAVLDPAQLRAVDPAVRAFYQNPTRFVLHVAGNYPDRLDRLLLGKLAPALSGLGRLPTAEALAESDLYRDAAGRTHWDRYVVRGGTRQALFIARFERVAKQIKETFYVHGLEVALYFDVEPYQRGLRLTLDRRRSSWLAMPFDITFITLPTAGGVASTGEFADRAGWSGVTARFRMTPVVALTRRGTIPVQGNN